MKIRSRPFSKWILFSVSIVVVGFALYFFIGFIAVIFVFTEFSDDYSAQDLAENYDSHKIQIEEVKRYVQSVVPENRDVHIEFNDDNTLEIFHVTIRNPKYDVCGHHYEYQIDFDSDGAENQLSYLGWTTGTLDTLYEKLQSANCISVETSRYGSLTGNPLTIGYRRSGMGMYFYKLPEQPVSDSIIKLFADNGRHRYIWYNREVFLGYSGGAVGRQGFTDDEIAAVDKMQ